MTPKHKGCQVVNLLKAKTYMYYVHQAWLPFCQNDQEWGAENVSCLALAKALCPSQLLSLGPSTNMTYSITVISERCGQSHSATIKGFLQKMSYQQKLNFLATVHLATTLSGSDHHSRLIQPLCIGEMPPVTQRYHPGGSQTTSTL